MIEIQDLKKIYGERTVLNIPSLRFENGSSTVLAGANGRRDEHVLLDLP